MRGDDRRRPAIMGSGHHDHGHDHDAPGRSASRKRLREPHEVAGPLMLAVAVGGLIVNLLGLAILHRGRDESLNVRGAWLHVLTDAWGASR